MSDQELEELLEKGRSWLKNNRTHVKYTPQLDKFCEAWAEMDERKQKAKKLF